MVGFVDIVAHGDIEFDFFFGAVELAADLGVFGEDSAAGAPEAVDSFADEEFLDCAVGVKAFGEGIDQAVVFALVFPEVRGIEDKGAGVEAVFVGVLAGDVFSLVGFGSG